MNKIITETEGHLELKELLKNIATLCKFRFDVEIALNFSGGKDENGNFIDESSIDVAFFGEEEQKKFLFIFQCKESDLKKPNKTILADIATRDQISQNKAKIINSEQNNIKEKDLQDLKEIRICYVFSNKLKIDRLDQLDRFFSSHNINYWNYNALIYFNKVAQTIGNCVKYEIFKEFNLSFEVRTIIIADAVQIKQNHREMFFFGATPSDLLKVCYVSRRAAGKSTAYQRIISAKRIKRISKFLKYKEALLPNAIIIAFDRDRKIQEAIKFESGKLHYPLIYCSAWIIDGQHRVYGFLNTKYARKGSDKFRLPVVAFKNLDDILQNRTFVNINYYQKKIDPTLLCDLATSVPDLQNELTWPGLLVKALNKTEPLQGLIKISEMDKGKPISISSFSRYGLLEGLLGYDGENQKYKGPLYRYSPFNPRKLYKNKQNQLALRNQITLLSRFFLTVKVVTQKKDIQKNPWINIKEYALLKPTGINALLLLLARIMKEYPDGKLDMVKLLKPLASVNFKRDAVAKHGGGWKGFRQLANIMIYRINKKSSVTLRFFGKKEKT